MSKALRITLIIIGFIFMASGLVFAGTWIGHGTLPGFVRLQSAYRMMDNGGSTGRGNGPGMLGNRRSSSPGIMGGYGYNTSVTPLTVDQALQVAGEVIIALNNPDLKIAEVMVFDNNAYVRVVEQSTGIGAFELLVDPASLIVTPEHGPNMMWNLKYPGLNHQFMMGGCDGMVLAPRLCSGTGAGLGNPMFSTTPAAVSGTMPVIQDAALQAAQQYLDTALPGTRVVADADPFYGYYTIDILRDGRIIGMLSVNGTSSQVFMHTWHGTFITMQDY